jgi:hypothetical protein
MAADFNGTWSEQLIDQNRAGGTIRPPRFSFARVSEFAGETRWSLRFPVAFEALVKSASWHNFPRSSLYGVGDRASIYNTVA